jgi:hypothetical protein
MILNTAKSIFIVKYFKSLSGSPSDRIPNPRQIFNRLGALEDMLLVVESSDFRQLILLYFIRVSCRKRRDWKNILLFSQIKDFCFQIKWGWFFMKDNN